MTNASVTTAVSLADTGINAAGVSATIITTNYFKIATLILSSAAALLSKINRDQGRDTPFLGDIRAELDEVVNSIDERHQHMSHRWTHRLNHPLHAIESKRIRESAQLQEHQDQHNAR